MMTLQVTSLSKWDSLVGEEGLLKPSERPVVLNRSPIQSLSSKLYMRLKPYL